MCGYCESHESERNALPLYSGLITKEIELSYKTRLQGAPFSPSLSLRQHSTMLSRAVQRARSRSARLPWPASRRSLQSAAASLSSPPLAASDDNTVHLLRELDALLQSYPLLESAWPSRIAAAVEKSADPSRPATIAGQSPLFLIGLLLSPWRGLTSAVGAVVGERDSGASQLVTTLLDDPLASDDRVALTLESRRLDPNAPEAILIRSVEAAFLTLDP